MLQAVAGSRTLTPEQLLACDVTGNGTISTLDAVRILQLKVGTIAGFEVAQACGSDWAFIPVPAAAANQLVTAPQMTTGSCQAGAIAWNPLVSQADNQNFSAVLFGDCTGNWQPSGGGGAARSRIAAAVNVGHAQRRGTHLRVPLVVEGARRFFGLDIEVVYDPTRLSFRALRRVGPASPALLAANERRPGLINISLASPEPLPVGTLGVLLLEEINDHSDARPVRVISAEAADE